MPGVNAIINSNDRLWKSIFSRSNSEVLSALKDATIEEFQYTSNHLFFIEGLGFKLIQMTPFSLLSTYKEQNILDELLEHVNSNEALQFFDHNCFHIACFYNNLQACESYLNCIKNKNNNNNNNNYDFVNYQTIRELWSPLHIAAVIGSVDLCKLLLKYQPRISKDINGDSPLHLAVNFGLWEMCELLINYDPTMTDIQNSIGETVLHRIVIHNHSPIFNLILNSIGDLNQQDDWGSTALHIAVRKGKRALALQLIKNFIQSDILNIRGEKATDSIVDLKFKSEIEQLIQKVKMKLILYQRANGTENYPSNIIVRLGKFKLITENNINLSSLHLQSLPKLLFKLTFIQELDLSNNDLKDLPEEMKNLNSLKVLNLSSNQFDRIPAVILNFKKTLQSLKMGNNPFVYFQEMDLIAKENNLENIMIYLYERSEGMIYWNHVKITVFGKENVGKTSLVKTIAGKVKADVETSTEGISFTALTIISTKLKSTKIRCKFWDFAGQDTFYSTHSFYITNRGIYLAVWNVSDITSLFRIKYWIKSVYASLKKQDDRKNVKIIAVCTHINTTSAKEEFKRQVDEFLSNSKYKFDDIIDVDSYNVYNIQKLVEKLVGYSEELVLKQKVPKNYKVISEFIHEIKSIHRANMKEKNNNSNNYNNNNNNNNNNENKNSNNSDKTQSNSLKESYFDQMKSLLWKSTPTEVPTATKDIHKFSTSLLKMIDINDQAPLVQFNKFADTLRLIVGNIQDKNIKRILEFLHSNGEIIYFDSPQLKDIIILDCNWLNNAMMTIIHPIPNGVNTNDAIITVNMLNQLWKPKFPLHLHPFLIEVLGKFDVLRKISGDNYFIPYLLNDDKPNNVDSYFLFYHNNNININNNNNINNNKYDNIIIIGDNNPPNHNLNSKLKLISRKYYLSFFPVGLMARLQSNLLDKYDLPLRWRNGCIVKLRDKSFSSPTLFLEIVQGLQGQISFISDDNELSHSQKLNTADDCIKLLLEYETQSTNDKLIAIQFLRYVTGLIESLCIDWYNILDQVYCVIPQTDIHILTASIVKFVTQSNNQLISYQDLKIDANDLIPDIILDDLNKYYIRPRDLKLIKVLGEGAFGVVYKAIWLTRGLKVAVKIIKKITVHENNENNEEKIEDHTVAFLREILMSKQFLHPNFAQFCGYGVGKLVFTGEDNSNEISRNENNIVNNNEIGREENVIISEGIFAVNELVEGVNLSEYLTDPFELRKTLEHLLNVAMKLQSSKSLAILDKEATIQKQQEYIKLNQKLLTIPKFLSFSPRTIINASNDFINNASKETYDCLLLTLRKTEQNYIDSLPPLPDSMLIDITIDIAKAIQYMQTLEPPIIHRDLKSDNCLVQMQSDNFKAIKITDFGLTTTMYINEMMSEKKAIGGLQWTAPEIFDNQPYSTSSDIYSFAIIMWELLHRGLGPYYQIFKDPDQHQELLIGHVIDKNRPIIESKFVNHYRKCTEELIDKEKGDESHWVDRYIQLMKSCWNHDPSQRMKINDILEELTYIHQLIDHTFTPIRFTDPKDTIIYLQPNPKTEFKSQYFKSIPIRGNDFYIENIKNTIYCSPVFHSNSIEDNIPKVIAIDYIEGEQKIKKMVLCYLHDDIPLRYYDVKIDQLHSSIFLQNFNQVNQFISLSHNQRFILQHKLTQMKHQATRCIPILDPYIISLKVKHQSNPSSSISKFSTFHNCSLLTKSNELYIQYTKSPHTTEYQYIKIDMELQQEIRAVSQEDIQIPFFDPINRTKNLIKFQISCSNKSSKKEIVSLLVDELYSLVRNINRISFSLSNVSKIRNPFLSSKTAGTIHSMIVDQQNLLWMIGTSEDICTLRIVEISSKTKFFHSSRAKEVHSIPFINLIFPRDSPVSKVVRIKFTNYLKDENLILVSAHIPFYKQSFLIAISAQLQTVQPIELKVYLLKKHSVSILASSTLFRQPSPLLKANPPINNLESSNIINIEDKKLTNSIGDNTEYNSYNDYVNDDISLVLSTRYYYLFVATEDKKVYRLYLTITDNSLDVSEQQFICSFNDIGNAQLGALKNAIIMDSVIVFLLSSNHLLFAKFDNSSSQILRFELDPLNCISKLLQVGNKIWGYENGTQLPILHIWQ